MAALNSPDLRLIKRFNVLCNLHIPDIPLEKIFHYDPTHDRIPTQQLLGAASNAGQPLMISIAIRRREYDHGLEQHLLSSFPDFPSRLLRRLYESNAESHGSVVLPSLLESKSLAFLANYPRLEEQNNSGETDGARNAQAQVRFVPLLCWCSSVDHQSPWIPDHSTRVAVVVLVTFDMSVASKMSDFWALPKRQIRLAKFEQWAFLDLAAVLSDWPVIWANTRRELASLHGSMYSSNKAISDLSTTRIIHQDMANIIALREELRLFIAAYGKLRQILKRAYEGNTASERVEKLWWSTARGPVPDVIKEAEISRLKTLLSELESRLEDSQTNLEHQLETSAVIIRQLENMLSLTFNTQAITQNHSMATLNLMATVFLPLSFVASIFGMTEFSISAVWYPLAALVVLFLVGAVLFALSRVSPIGGASLKSKARQKPMFHLFGGTSGSPRSGKGQQSSAFLDVQSPKPAADSRANILYDIVEDPLSPLSAPGRPPPPKSGPLRRIFQRTRRKEPALYPKRQISGPALPQPQQAPPLGRAPPAVNNHLPVPFSAATPLWHILPGGGVRPPAPDNSHSPPPAWAYSPPPPRAPSPPAAATAVYIRAYSPSPPPQHSSPVYQLVIAELSGESAPTHQTSAPWGSIHVLPGSSASPSERSSTPFGFPPPPPLPSPPPNLTNEQVGEYAPGMSPNMAGWSWEQPLLDIFPEWIGTSFSE